MIQYQVLYWRDIPAQIKLFAGRRPRSHTLPARFQLAIDRIAMQEGLVGTDAYLDQWHWSEKQERARHTRRRATNDLARNRRGGRPHPRRV